MTGMVYFLECAGRIKIGFTTNLEQRQREIATSAPAPLSLLGTVSGTRLSESLIHRHLSAFRSGGEWFHDCRKVRTVIAQILSDGTDWIPPKVPKTDPILSAALRKLAEPLTCDDTIKTAIGRVAAKVGISKTRAFDIWYGKARRVSIAEASMIEAALIASREQMRRLGGMDRAKGG